MEEKIAHVKDCCCLTITILRCIRIAGIVILLEKMPQIKKKASFPCPGNTTASKNSEATSLCCWRWPPGRIHVGYALSERIYRSGLKTTSQSPQAILHAWFKLLEIQTFLQFCLFGLSVTQLYSTKFTQVLCHMNLLGSQSVVHTLPQVDKGEPERTRLCKAGPHMSEMFSRFGALPLQIRCVCVCVIATYFHAVKPSYLERIWLVFIWTLHSLQTENITQNPVRVSHKMFFVVKCSSLQEKKEEILLFRRHQIYGNVFASLCQKQVELTRDLCASMCVKTHPGGELKISQTEKERFFSCPSGFSMWCMAHWRLDVVHKNKKTGFART